MIECVVLPKHVWNAEVLSETLDTGMTNMDQIAHTPRDGYINTNISESLTGNVTDCTNTPNMGPALF